MKKTLLVVAALLAVSLALSGCRKANGGGWLASTVEGEKATFGFNIKCDAKNAGQIQYIDHGAGVKIHAVVDFVKCFEAPDNWPVDVNATYENGAGSIRFTAQDAGEPGPGAGDNVSIEVTGGTYDGYANSGPLLGGNIQFFK